MGTLFQERVYSGNEHVPCSNGRVFGSSTETKLIFSLVLFNNIS